MVIAPPGSEDPDSDATAGMPFGSTSPQDLGVSLDEWSVMSYGGGTASGPADPSDSGGPSRVLLAVLVGVVALVVGVLGS